MPMKRVRLNTVSLSKTYCKIAVGKYLSAVFPIKNGLKQGNALSPLF
jgi:hypothetical protein